MLEVDGHSGDVAGVGTPRPSEDLPRAAPPLGPGSRAEFCAEVAEVAQLRSEAISWRLEAERARSVPTELRDARYEAEAARLELSTWRSRAESEARRRADLATELWKLDGPRRAAEAAAEERAEAEARENIRDCELGWVPYNKTYVSVLSQLRSRLDVVQSAAKIVDERVTNDQQLEKSVRGCLR